jgi:integrase/recombinase XerC
MFGRDHAGVWQQAIDDWTITLRAAKRSPLTIRQRRWQLRNLAEANLGRSPWKLTTDELAAWIGGHDWSAETCKAARSAVNAFYTWAVASKRSKRNPAAQLNPVSVPRRLPRPASDAALAAALERADARTRVMLLLAAFGGLRVGEIAVLRWADVGNGWLIVRGKRDDERRVPTAAAVGDALERWRFVTGGGEFVFPGKRGGMNPTHVSQVLSRALGPGTTAHMLRHRVAMNALEGTGNLAAVQELLGHVSPETTKIYSRASDRSLIEAVNAI